MRDGETEEPPKRKKGGNPNGNPEAMNSSPRCKAMSRSTGNPCPNPAMRGLEVCYHHGGAPKHAREAGLRRWRAEQEVKQLEAQRDAIIASEGLSGVKDPLEALSTLATEAMAMQQAAGRRVNSLGAAITHTDNDGKKHLEEVVGLYERAMDRSGKFLDMLVKHGFTERQVKLHESQAAVVLGIIRRTLDAMELTSEQQKKAQKAMAAEFRDMDILGEE